MQREAGTLGVPTWVVLGQHMDWRWHTDVEQSEWYPRMRLFKAESGEEWPERIQRAKKSLQE